MCIRDRSKTHQMLKESSGCNPLNGLVTLKEIDSLEEEIIFNI